MCWSYVFDPRKPSTYKGRLLIHSLGCEALARYMIDDIYSQKARKRLKAYLDAILDHHPDEMYYHVDLDEFDFTDIKRHELDVLTSLFIDYKNADKNHGLFVRDLIFRKTLHDKSEEAAEAFLS